MEERNKSEESRRALKKELIENKPENVKNQIL